MAFKHFEDDSDDHIEDSWKGDVGGEPTDIAWAGRAVFYEPTRKSATISGR